MPLTLTRTAAAALSLLLCASASLLFAEQDKQVIERADDLPRVAYPFSGKLTELLDQPEQLQGFFNKARSEIDDQLERFEIRDPATVRSYISSLRVMDLLDGDDAAATEKIAQVRELLSKPSDKLTHGLLTEAIIEARAGGITSPNEEFKRRFAKAYADLLNPLPWEVIQDDVKSTNGTFQYLSPALMLGGIENSMQVNVDRTGEISLGEVTSLASVRFNLDWLLPVSEQIVEVTRAYIEANKVEKSDIWAARDVDISNREGLTPVIIAINDSGVDADIFMPKGQMWINPNETFDGTDSDGNGFIDDVHGIAFDKESNRTSGDLYPLDAAQQAAYPEQLDLTKGLLDLQAAIDSEEAAKTRDRLSNLTSEEYKPFIEELSLYGNYTHGTHVAGIAAAGNPAARILNVRITFGHEMIPDKPTIEEAIRSAQSIRDLGKYLRDQGVRIMNMSWGGSQAGVEYALKANGIGDDPEQRAEIARVLFNISYDALYEEMKASPEVLFIPAAGNSDSDIDFHKVIPSSIDLPNVLVVGAVDQAGDETDFTSYGANIRAHANGFEVESYVPGGRRLPFSGTSMSAPNVANLAAKLLAIDPSLNPQQVISLIELGIEKSEDGRRLLIHPARSIALLDARRSKW